MRTAIVLIAGVIVLIAGVILGAALVVFAWYRSDITEAYLLVAGRSHRVATPLGDMEYVVAGEGTPALVIHGTGGGFDQGLEMVAPLQAYGYQIIAPSRFGYLGSRATAPVTLDTQADAFIPLLDSLNVEKAVVFGGSAGALPAMAFAIRHPERCRALVLLVPAAYAPTRKPKTSGAEGPLLEGIVSTLLSSDFLFWSMQKAMPGTMARILLATDPSVIAAAPPPEQARFWTTMRHILPVNSRRDGILFDMAHAGDPPEMDLSAIRCPVLAISARDDMFGTAAPAEYIAANVPDGRSVVYDSGGHLWMGHQDEVWAEVTSFLAPLRDRGAAGVARAVP